MWKYDYYLCGSAVFYRACLSFASLVSVRLQTMVLLEPKLDIVLVSYVYAIV